MLLKFRGNFWTSSRTRFSDAQFLSREEGLLLHGGPPHLKVEFNTKYRPQSPSSSPQRPSQQDSPYSSSSKQMTKTPQCKVPRKKVDRLDHTTFVGTSFSRHLGCHLFGDAVKSGLCTARALLRNSLPQLRGSDCRSGRGEPALDTVPTLKTLCPG
jgi:hypothetical protein